MPEDRVNCYTPTPWRVGDNGTTIYAANGRVISNCAAVNVDLAESMANAVRIVQCVNDCAALVDPARAMCDVAEALEAAIEAAAEGA